MNNDGHREEQDHGDRSIPLLRWGIEHSDTDQLRRAAHGETTHSFDPKLVEMILGRDDAIRMREATSATLDTSKTMAERRSAFALLHDLVENVDNANNMIRMDLWPGMLSFLDGTDRELAMDALRLVALASKNNEETSSFLATTGVLDRLVDTLEGNAIANDLPVLRKLLMALSALASSKGSAKWEAFMEQRSAAFFRGLLDRHESLQDGVLFIYLNYAWARKRLPACLHHDQQIVPLLEQAHLEHCSDPECLLPLPHRASPNSN